MSDAPAPAPAAPAAPPGTTLTVAALQMVSGPDVAANLATAAVLIAEAAARGARLVALPEYFCLLGLSDRDKLAVAEAPGEGPIQQALADAARAHGVWVIGGTLPLRVSGDPGHVSNTSLVLDPAGRIRARYDKLHLFRFDDGQRRYDETATLVAGREPVAASVEVGGRPWRVGLSVCYDLRFPELYRALMHPPCDLLAVPSAFTDVTGRAHWELLLRARAVENQCYVIAPAQGGLHANGRRTWGHSMVIDPWGEVLACRDEEGEGVVLATLDTGRLAQVRTALPALAHRR
jgi:nitrilase